MASAHELKKVTEEYISKVKNLQQEYESNIFAGNVPKLPQLCEINQYNDIMIGIMMDLTTRLDRIDSFIKYSLDGVEKYGIRYKPL